MTQEFVLSVRNLSVDFTTDDGVVHAVDDLSFDLARSETLGIVGESGSGKSVTALAIMGLLPPTASITGEAGFDGANLIGRPDKQLQPIRGNRIAMIFQDALAALNPVHRVGDQIAEAIAVHHHLSRADLRARTVELLDLVGIPNPIDRAGEYPHQYSGGMRQRAMIAMAIANDPDVLIADEPTTALDVTIQAQVLDVLERVQDAHRHRDHPHHPRPRRRRRRRRPGTRHVRRARRRAGFGRRRVLPAQPPLHAACSRRSPDSTADPTSTASTASTASRRR